MPATSVTSESSTEKQQRAFERLTANVRGCVACSRMAHAHALGAANGPLDAQVMFVAEAPGRRGAAITGVPLTRDESGRRFDAFLRIADLSRDEVFVTNALLCSPVSASGANRAPLRSELARCRPFLSATLEVIHPKIVVALGRVALDALGAIHPHDLHLHHHVGGAFDWHGRTLFVLYHPSRQSTLHRPHGQQESDWRRLGQIVNS